MTVRNKREFGDLLRTSRQAAHLTQEALAERAGISARAVTDLERGVIRAPRQDTLDLLADALELSPSERQEWHRLRRQLSTRQSPSGSPNARKKHLPQPPSSLIGRGETVRALIELLTHSENRLVTITGPGGVGKTRVALAAGHQLTDTFRDGIRYIELAAVRDPALLLAVVAQELRLREGDEAAIRERLRKYLARRHMLLILDNFEQLLPAAPDLAALLASAPLLNLLVTSRARLQIRAEQEFPLAPLPVPGVPRWNAAGIVDEIESSPAIQLFQQRSQQVLPSFSVNPDNAPAVSAICSHLDGLPLAIELAAARIKVLTPQQMLPRLLHRFEFLTEGSRDAPDRHRTMRAAIGWSYDLLGPENQRLFRVLSSFVGGWTLEAADAVAPAGSDVLDGLSTLANNSLVHQVLQSNGRSRFGMLETVREFGLDQLQQHGEYEDARLRHSRYFLELAESAAPELRGPQQGEWLGLLEEEMANLRTALEWSERADVDPDIGLRLAGALSWFWESRGHVSEGRGWLTRALAREASDACIRMHALCGAGWLAHIQRDSDTAREHLDEALSIAHDTYDQWTASWIYHLLGRVAYFDGDAQTARAFGEQSLDMARAIGNRWIIAWAYHLLALAAHIDGDYRAARNHYEESLHIREEIGYPEGMGTVTGLLGMLTLREGDHAAALRLLRKSLLMNRELGARWIIINMVANIVMIAALYGEADRAAKLAGFVAAMSDTVGASPIPIADSAFQEGLTAARERLDDSTYEQLWSEGQSMSMDEAIDEALLVGGTEDSIG